MKFNSVKQSQPVILFTKPSLTQSFVSHTSLILHPHIIFLYLSALCTWNVTDLSVRDETGEGRAVLQPWLCLCLVLSTFTSPWLWKNPQPLSAHLAHAETSNTPFCQDALLLFLQNINKMQIIIIIFVTTTEVRVILFISKITALLRPLSFACTGDTARRATREIKYSKIISRPPKAWRADSYRALCLSYKTLGSWWHFVQGQGLGFFQH